MTCHTCRFYRPDSCRRHSPSATGWPFVQPDDTCGDWEAAVAIPDAVEQLGETIGKMRDVVGVADAEPPTPPAPRWIVDRVPTVGDGDKDGDVAISARSGVPGHYTAVSRRYVHPGTPWAPTDAIPDEPFDPTTLDRNGWIRSRLPGEGDASSSGEVKAPRNHGRQWICFTASHIVPGQPWAPADSEPGEYWP